MKRPLYLGVLLALPILLLIGELPAAAALRVGFGRALITPQLPDSWQDVNGDAVYEKDIDHYQDNNGNGRFDAVWMAGFQNSRPAQGVHLPLESIAVVMDDGDTRIGIVTADVVGLMSSFVARLRARIPPAWGIDYLLVHATHNHEGPDTQGLWGPGSFTSGVDPAYMLLLARRMELALGDAVAALEPSRLEMTNIQNYPRGLVVTDTRKPLVIDHGIRVLLFRRPDNSVIGTLVNVGIHVELTWDKNLQLTPDIAGYLRRGLDQGIRENGELKRAGLGGTSLWLTGNIGGLMTSLPGDAIFDRFLGRDVSDAGHAKAQAFGYSVADAVLSAVQAGELYEDPAPRLAFRSRKIQLPLNNIMLSLASLLGVVDATPGFRFKPPFLEYHSEVGVLQIGAAQLAAVPGELYPEIAVGGIENPVGADFDVAPVEVPALRSHMTGRVNLMVNLANDALGYIIPKSEWDADAPWIYDSEEESYGEVVSLGPDTAAIVHHELLRLLDDAARAGGAP